MRGGLELEAKVEKKHSFVFALVGFKEEDAD